MNNYGYQLKDIMIYPPTHVISNNTQIFKYNLFGEYGNYSINELSADAGYPQEFNLSSTDMLAKYQSIIDRIIRAFYMKYKNYYITFERPESFLSEFMLRFNKRVVELHYKTESAKKLYNITDDELMTSEHHIIALSNNNASVDVTDNEQYLQEIQGYVDQQKGSKIKSNKFDAFLKYYTFVENDLLLDFINELKTLFIIVIPCEKYIYRGE